MFLSKLCPQCGLTKPTTEFYRRPDRASGVQSRCKACCRVRGTSYRRAHPEVIAAWRHAHRKELAAGLRLARQADPERFRGYDKKRNGTPSRKAHDRDRDRTADRLIYERERRGDRSAYRKELYRRDPEKYIRRVRERQKLDPLGTLVRTQRYRSAKLGVDMSGLVKALLDGLARQQDGRCFYCHAVLVRFDLDHKTPLARGGDSSIDNLCLACRHCNRSKHTQTAEEFFVTLSRRVTA